VKKVVLALFTILLIFSLTASGCSLFRQNTSAPAPTSGNGVLNLYGIDPNTLDPAVASETTSAEYIMQIYSGLVGLDDNLEPVPDIAEKWEISPDGLTYTFTLRQDVKFQNGRQLKAGDFKYSWERAASPGTNSQTAATYLGDIIGINDVLMGKSREAGGIKVLDDYTLQVTVDSPKSYFLFKLTYPTTSNTLNVL